VNASGTDGILGGSGVLLEPTGGYTSRNKVGWNGTHLDRSTAVDLVGRAWFVKETYKKYILLLSVRWPLR